MKSLLNIVFWIVVIAGIVIAVSFIETENKKVTCTDFEVIVDYGGADPLISHDEIKASIFKSFDTLTGKKLNDLNLVEIENMVNQIECIANADIYTTLTGKMSMKVKQRHPIVRIINAVNQGFYIDQYGEIFPTNRGFPSRVLIASGNFDLHYSDTLKIEQNGILADVYKLATFIQNDPFLRLQIEQIFVTKDREFELVPKVGRHVIIFGTTEKMEEKFRKLLAFYHQGINHAGWSKYKSINLKFENQVVCSKK